jgi:hypothetical protein
MSFSSFSFCYQLPSSHLFSVSYTLFKMRSFPWSSLLIVAIQTLSGFTLTINRSLNASVDAQATLLGRQDPSYLLADIIH